MKLDAKQKEQVRDYLAQVNTLKGSPSSNKGLKNGRQRLQLLSKEPYTSKKGNKMLKVKWYNIDDKSNDFVYLLAGKKAYKNTQNIKVGEVFDCVVGGVGGFIQVTPIRGLDERPLPTEGIMEAKHVIAYDIEVFKYNWSFVFTDVLSGIEMKLEDNLPLLEKFLNAHENDVFVGYNSIGYDKHIRKSIRDNKDPFVISQEIIHGSKKDNKVWKMYNGRVDSLVEIDLYQDNAGFSLKEHNGFNGLTIKESDVDFEIDRPLTEEEKAENMKYNAFDVDGTVVRFMKIIGDLQTKAMLCEMYNLDYTWLSKTNASLIAEILKAEWHEDRGDLFDKYEKPEWITFNDPEILAQVNEWILDRDDIKRITKVKDGEEYETTDLAFQIKLRDITVDVGSGGIHGALLNYIKTGEIIQSDVGSLYPWTIVLHGYLSRNIPEKFKHFYSDILKDRMKYKKAGEKVKEKAMKLVLNTMYGVLRAKFNALFDPRMAVLINITGQLAMLDLADKIQPHAFISAMNTDSINYEPFSEQDKDIIQDIKRDWCERSGYTLDDDIITDIAQRDINNYVCRFDNGDIKTKGAVSMGGGTKYSKAVVMNAVKEYFMNKVEPEKYVSEREDLREFQMITKTGHTFKETRAYTSDDDFTKIQKVNRIYAVKNGVGQSVKIKKFKLGTLEEPKNRTKENGELTADYVRYLEKAERAVELMEELGDEAGMLAFGYEYGTDVKGVANEPDNYIIDNENVYTTSLKREDLDDQYYIDEAWRAIRQYQGLEDIDEEEEV